jgi:predicted dinucleotide-utilizing enzyme
VIGFDTTHAELRAKLLLTTADAVKAVDAAVRATSGADVERYCQQIMHAGQDLVNDASALVEAHQDGGCIR